MFEGSGAGVKVAVYAALMYEIVAACCSSPQTTEINADTRADTLMKWVYLGLAQGALFVGIGVVIEMALPNGEPWTPIFGGGLAGALLYGQYVHARNSGLRSDEPGTEDYAYAS